jgi:hypothetical protein
MSQQSYISLARKQVFTPRDQGRRLTRREAAQFTQQVLDQNAHNSRILNGGLAYNNGRKRHTAHSSSGNLLARSNHLHTLTFY